MRRASSSYALVVSAITGWLGIGANTAMAMPMVTVGTLSVYAGQPDQQVAISVTDSAGLADNVQGMDFAVEIVTSGSGPFPAITAVDVVGSAGSPTIFTGNNTGGSTPAGGDFPQLQYRTISSASGAVDPNGVLAYITIDTTGVLPGSYPLNLTGTSLGDTDFISPVSPYIVDAAITNGTLSVVAVPEPAAVSLLCVAGFALLRQRTRA